MNHLNVGIIGLGVGLQHIAGYNAHPSCKVSKVCDLNSEKQKELVKLSRHIEFSTDPSSILSDPSIHIISIASYDNFHFDQIFEALKNNKHVFVEKPLCLHRHEADAIWKLLLKKKTLKLSSNLILRKCPRFIQLRDRINNGEMGKISYIEGAYNYGRIHKLVKGWRGEIDFYSVTHGGGVHLLDLFYWLSNSKVESVAGFGNRIATDGTQFEYNDLVAGILEFSDGSTGQITSNFGCVHPHFHELNVYGTKQTFKNGWPHGNYYKSRDMNEPPELVEDEYPGSYKGDHLYEFVESIINEIQEPISAKEVLDVMAVCFALEEAVERKKVVRVKYFE